MIAQKNQLHPELPDEKLNVAGTFLKTFSRDKSHLARSNNKITVASAAANKTENQKTQDIDEKQLEILLEKGLQMVKHLMHLQPDNEAVLAAYLYPAYDAFNFNSETFEKQFGHEVMKLLRDVHRMKFIETLQEKSTSFSQKNEQADKLRKM